MYAFSRITVLTSAAKMISAMGMGTWNITHSTNPLVKVSSLVHVGNNGHFSLQNGWLSFNGEFRVDFPRVQVRANKLVEVDLSITIHNFDSMQLEHGIFEYYLRRI